ncbi:hypothetical protein FM110_07640 [Brachybacterium nesterenkovii]|uniref:Uncharacterized protein n=1 Tax=Brachybacterium nesterenkovii TaxID=47847 RepID=A0A1X6X101_9MICO|nr:hypothetical protein FM110_07640 [Brachybacterium nesterenkovii]
MDQFYSLARTGLRILKTDEAAVSAAFVWMDDADGSSEAPDDEDLVS